MIEQLYMLCFALMKLLMPLAIIAFFGGLACVFASTFIKTKSIVKGSVRLTMDRKTEKTMAFLAMHPHGAEPKKPKRCYVCKSTKGDMVQVGHNVWKCCQCLYRKN